MTSPPKRRTTATPAERGGRVNELLAKEYPNARCSLHFRSPYELLAATILSAQCTDERVNMVTPALFRKYPSPAALAKAEVADIEEAVRTTGFFRNKAKSLKGMAEAVLRDHGGKVPGTMEELCRLPGVGRKTANVLLGNCFSTPGITVDTHVNRVSQRLGLTRHTDPEKVERDLMECIPAADWTRFSHRVIQHGRNVCQARRPRCECCALTANCSYFAQFHEKPSPPSRDDSHVAETGQG